MGSYLLENDTQINSQVQDPGNPILTSVSEDSKIDFKALSDSQQYNLSNLSSDQSKPQNQPNFITLGKI